MQKQKKQAHSKRGPTKIGIKLKCLSYTTVSLFLVHFHN